MDKFHLVPYPEQITVMDGYTAPNAKITEKETDTEKKEAYLLKISENEIHIE